MFGWIKRLFTTKSTTAVATTGGLAADIPIRSASEDLLSREVIARRIAEILGAPGTREGRVFAIRGNWGSGKSSLKNMVIEALKAGNPGAHHLEFNPWQWGDSDAIARALFEQMASHLGGEFAPEAASRAKAIRHYGDMLVGGGGPLAAADDGKGIVGWLTALTLLLGSVGVGYSIFSVQILAAIAIGSGGLLLLIGKILRWWGKDRSAEPLDTVRVDLEQRLGQLDGPLVIFVDDIDRLEPEQIRMLFRQIKVNANLPNILFVLLFQPSIVENALNPVAGTEGREYLEKIVQAHFDLPPIAPDQLMKIFGLQLGTIVDHLAVDENGFQQLRWANVMISGILPFVRNLRDVRRLLTSIEIHLPFHNGPRVFEANIIDFIALEALRVFEPTLHSQIASNESLLLQSGRISQDGRASIDRETIEALISSVRSDREEACRMILKELFPPIGSMVGGSSFSGESWHRGWLNEKRVCTSRHFSRYFQFQLPDGAVSESDFADLVEAATDADRLKGVIETFRDRGSLTTLAARFDESVDQLPISDIERILPALFELGEELSSEPGADGPFNTPFVSAWRAASWYLRGIDNKRERANYMLAAMESTKALSTPAILISLEIEAFEKPDSDREPELDREDLEPLKAAWIANMIERGANDPSLLDHDRLVGHLFRWKEFAGSASAARAWVDGTARTDAKRIKLLSRFLSVGSSQGWGDRISQKTESYRKDTLLEFFDLEDLMRWLKRLDRSQISSEDARVMDILQKHLDAWSRGEKIDRYLGE